MWTPKYKLKEYWGKNVEILTTSENNSIKYGPGASKTIVSVDLLY